MGYSSNFLPSSRVFLRAINKFAETMNQKFLEHMNFEFQVSAKLPTAALADHSKIHHLQPVEACLCLCACPQQGWMGFATEVSVDLSPTEPPVQLDPMIPDLETHTTDSQQTAPPSDATQWRTQMLLHHDGLWHPCAPGSSQSQILKYGLQ